MVFAASWALGFSQGDELVGKHRQDDSFICLTSDNQEKRRFVRQVLVERTMGIIERIPEIACPECKSELAEGIDLRCTGCDKHYEIQKGIPYMILDDMVRFKEEIEVQDQVAIEYEQVRYQNEYAKRYHSWWTNLMLSQVSVAGRILDNGCGIGNLFEIVPADRIVGLDLSTQMLKPYFSIDKVSYFGYIAYPVLGFPDMVSLFKFVPFKPFAAAAMMWLDKVISHIPFVRTQSWVILLKGTALETPLLT